MNKYKTSNTTVFLINYHFVFTPRYRRKLFLHPGVEERFIQLVREICLELDITVTTSDCGEDYVHLFLNAPPTLSPAEIMAKIKGGTSKKLREEFPHLQHLTSLWTRQYLVSTKVTLSKETIQNYVEQQKTRS